jgi:hypothetical protein
LTVLIPSLSSFSKKELIDLCTEHDVEWLDLPMKERRFDVRDEIGEERGDVVRISFNAERMRERAGRNNPDIPTVDELKVAVVLYLNETQPELLACKVETMLKEEGHVVLWTPPYCPELQPIEMFWGAGKNHAALKNFTGRKMRDAVNHLREGWNGNGHLFSHLPHPTKDDFVAGDIHQGFKSPVDCRKLFWSASRSPTKSSSPCVRA